MFEDNFDEGRTLFIVVVVFHWIANGKSGKASCKYATTVARAAVESSGSLSSSLEMAVLRRLWIFNRLKRVFCSAATIIVRVSKHLRRLRREQQATDVQWFREKDSHWPRTQWTMGNMSNRCWRVLAGNKRLSHHRCNATQSWTSTLNVGNVLSDKNER